MKRKPKVEAWAWAVVSDETDPWISWDKASVEHEADCLRDRDDTAHVKIIALIPADPLARLKEDVARAAKRWADAWERLGDNDATDADGEAQADARDALMEAVERLERKR